MKSSMFATLPHVMHQSAMKIADGMYDCIVTDPPYYDAIPYSDLMDFFYVWLKRALHGVDPEFEKSFSSELSPKWDLKENDGELIDDDSRHERNAAKSKTVYEEGMANVFLACNRVLEDTGRLVIVFAHKHPDAWETLVSAIICSGFVVDGSWPIQTEMGNRTRALSGAALASSVWLICKKRPVTARPGWDNKVLEEMRANIVERLRDYWDAGIRGPDFVWAATGPALEAYSRHPVVKKANIPGEVMAVGEFLSHVRRMVVDFVVGRMLTGEHHAGSEAAAVDRMDAPTAYYLLHRHDFGLAGRTDPGRRVDPSGIDSKTARPSTPGGNPAGNLAGCMGKRGIHRIFHQHGAFPEIWPDIALEDRPGCRLRIDQRTIHPAGHDIRPMALRIPIGTRRQAEMLYGFRYRRRSAW